MKTIGLIGGMTWESSLEYYRIINSIVRERFGGCHSAKCIMFSLDLEEVKQLLDKGGWAAVTRMMIDAAVRLENAGAELIVICTNTIHKTADEVQKNINIPLLHIVDATAEKIKTGGFVKVGLLGTRFIMEEDFYKGRLKEKYGIEVLVPDETDRELVDSVIFDELCQGAVKDASNKKFRRIIKSLADRGAQAVILGCTEIFLLLGKEDAEIPLLDTTRIHAEAAIEFALK